MDNGHEMQEITGDDSGTGYVRVIVDEIQERRKTFDK